MDKLKGLKPLLDKYKDVALSDSDIRNLLHDQTNIQVYGDLRKFSSIDELLKPYNCCIILYEWKKNFGHWVLLSRTDNLLEYFDPYGKFPDYYIDQLTEPWKSESHQNQKWLSRLMLNSNYELSFNEFPFQKLGKDVRTCGRWSVIRCMLKDLPLNDFRNLFLNIYGDDLATFLTSKI